MDTERPHGEVAPDALDLAIQAALNVDPSPEFLARVRARIADEPPPRRWTVTIVPALAAAATLAILALVAVNTTRRPIPEPAPATAPAEPVPNRSTAADVATQPGLPPSTPSTVRPSAPVPVRRAAAPTPQTDEARGLHALVDTINRGTVIVVVDEHASTQQATQIRSVEVAPLTISSISIEPIAPVAQ